ncbi:hypothetical protein [Kineococcus indalonis]|uniref:hypothetical protein n=1 Tax=Kineococcus indalonis TaxID=2696566 RepID=UPI001412B546|nr:hypothetical protein [Kineococcus indalonis]NAZ86072.1 hypothetical protein [Kineococcus indalonis]
MREPLRAGTGVLLLVVALAGCSTPAPESRLEEHGDRAEQIHAAMLEHVPADGDPAAGATSGPRFDEAGPLLGREHDTASWTTASSVRLAAGATPAEVAAAVGAWLREQRWTAEPTVDQGGTTPSVAVHRLAEPDGEWIVQVAWPAPGRDRRVSLSVQSPLTVRGSAPAPR